jgi:hypothetical protein
VLRFAIVDEQWQRRGRPTGASRRGLGGIVADHGKLMHMFLVRDDQTAFAHVHPTTDNQTEFRAALPVLPNGSYRVYADIVHASGYTRTLVDTIVIAQPIVHSARVDDDDSSWDGAATPKDAALRWIGPANISAGEEVEISAEAVHETGALVQLQPYMGMPGHAVVERNDGMVFVHLHPLGTISMAAQRAVAATSNTHTTTHGDASVNQSRVTFPYAFPTAGHYKVWVQVRTNEGVITSAFDVVVMDAQ